MFFLKIQKIINSRLIIGGERGFAPILIIGGARARAAPPESTPMPEATGYSRMDQQ